MFGRQEERAGTLLSLSDGAGLLLAVENVHPSMGITLTCLIDGFNLVCSRGPGVEQTVDEVRDNHRSPGI